MIISVASGKGGTGKTLIATSLALSLKNKYRVKLLDCDVEEPDDHIFMEPEFSHQEMVSIPVPEIDTRKCNYCGKCASACVYKAIAVWGKQILTFPQLCHGCGACSYLCPQRAILEVPRSIGIIESGQADGIDLVHGKLDVGEAMAPPVIRKVRTFAAGDKLNIIDSPPGTSCPVITAVKDTDFCLLVTEPTPFGLNDLVLAVEAVRELKIPCGVIINRNTGGDNTVEQYCQKEGIPVLLTIPLDTRIASLYSRGITLVKGMPEWEPRFLELFEKLNRSKGGVISSRQ